MGDFSLIPPTLGAVDPNLNITPRPDMSSAFAQPNPVGWTPQMGGGKFMGLGPANIAAAGGMLASAIAPRGINGRSTSLSRVSDAISMLGQTHIKALAAQQQQKDHMAFLQDMFKSRPELAQQILTHPDVMDPNKFMATTPADNGGYMFSNPTANVLGDTATGGLMAGSRGFNIMPSSVGGP